MRMGGRNEDVGRVSQHRPPPPPTPKTGGDENGRKFLWNEETTKPKLT